MNISALSVPVVQARIYNAMRLATLATTGVYGHEQKGVYQIAPHGKERAIVYIQNCKGNNFLRVDYTRGKGFAFYTDKDITKTVIQSLRS